MSTEPDSAEKAVAATTDSYGGPVSDEELAEAYLPAGQDEVDSSDHDPAGTKDSTDDEPAQTAEPTGVEPPD